MKHIKTSLHELRRLFGSTISVREITEHLVSFDAEHDAANARSLMAEKNYDVVGVRHAGLVVGFAAKEALGSGIVKDALIPFRESDVVENSATLSTALSRLKEQNFVFVRILGHVGGIVTRGDLQKAPFRMWIFGLISLIEMHLLRLVRIQYPKGEWERVLDAKRRVGAEKIYELRRTNNAECDLADCLQFCDKVDLLIRYQRFLGELGLQSKTQAERWFRSVQELRNDLAHANDIVHSRWPELVDMVQQCEQILERLEKMHDVKTS